MGRHQNSHICTIVSPADRSRPAIRRALADIWVGVGFPRLTNCVRPISTDTRTVLSSPVRSAAVCQRDRSFFFSCFLTRSKTSLGGHSPRSFIRSFSSSPRSRTQSAHFSLSPSTILVSLLIAALCGWGLDVIGLEIMSFVLPPVPHVIFARTRSSSVRHVITQPSSRRHDAQPMIATCRMLSNCHVD